MEKDEQGRRWEKVTSWRNPIDDDGAATAAAMTRARLTRFISDIRDRVLPLVGKIIEAPVPLLPWDYISVEREVSSRSSRSLNKYARTGTETDIYSKCNSRFSRYRRVSLSLRKWRMRNRLTDTRLYVLIERRWRLCDWFGDKFLVSSSSLLSNICPFLRQMFTLFSF